MSLDIRDHATLMKILSYCTNGELWEAIDEAHRLMAERREQNIANEKAILEPKIKAAFEAIVPIQAEYDAATLPIKKRVIKERRLDPAIKIHDDLASELSNLQYKYPPTHGGPMASA